jgi:putative FmdB family regulatory protein
MPVYEYICNECHSSFEAILTLKEHENEEVICPQCDSRNVEQDAADFHTVTLRMS